MKILIIEENRFREFIPAVQNQKEKDSEKKVLDVLESIHKNSHPQPTEKEISLYTISKLVKLFDTTRPTLYSWIDMGLLNPIKLGGRVYFNKSDIETLIANKLLENS